jgi:hypothetical protein
MIVEGVELACRRQGGVKGLNLPAVGRGVEVVEPAFNNRTKGRSIFNSSFYLSQTTSAETLKPTKEIMKILSLS